MRNNNLNADKIKGVSMLVLNAVENAVDRYGLIHSEFIQNAHIWFAAELGYKSARFLYHAFKQRNDAKLGYKDERKILEITQDKDLYNAIIEDLGYVMNIIPAAPNQLTLYK